MTRDATRALTDPTSPGVGSARTATGGGRLRFVCDRVYAPPVDALTAPPLLRSTSRHLCVAALTLTVWCLPQPGFAAEPAAATAAEAAPEPGAKSAAKPAPAKRRSLTRTERKKRAKAAALIRKIQRAAPGSERYRLVDQLIEIGDVAWPVVAPAVPGFLRLREGEAVAVDVLLGFMDLSYGALATTVGKLSDPAARRVVKFLLRLQPDARQTAVLQPLVSRTDAPLLLMVLPALMQRDRPRVMARLVELVDDKRVPVASFAVDTIAASRHGEAMPSLVRLLGIEQQRATPSNLDFRRKLIHAIARIGGEPAVPPLVEALNLDDQRPAVYEGMRIVGKPAVQAALFLLRTASGPRIAVAMQLLMHMRKEAAPHLVALLGTGNRSTRELVLDVLIRIGTPDVRPSLIRMVREEQFADVRDGVRLLSALYNGDVRAVFFKLLEDKDPAVRLVIVQQLWRLRDPKTFKVLRLVAARDKDRTVRIAAVRAVAGVGDPEGPTLLERMAVASDPFVRREVVEQLSRVGDWRSAVPALAELLADPNDRIFRATLAALQRMTFQPKKRRRAHWQAWVRQAKARKPVAKIQPDEVAFRSGAWRFAAQQRGEGPVVLVVSGPPFRDATHLAPQVWKLTSFAKVVVLKRAPGFYRAGRASQRVWSSEVDALARAAGAKRYVLLTDAAGASYALRHAAARKGARRVVVSGGWLPSPEAALALPGQLAASMGAIGGGDWTWALESQWRVRREVRLGIAYRGLLRGLLGVDHLGFGRQLQGVLADDALTEACQRRMQANAAAMSAKRVRKPTLLLLGSRAPWAETTPDAAKGSRAKVVTIKGAGAMPLLERPQQTVSAVESFVTGD